MTVTGFSNHDRSHFSFSGFVISCVDAIFDTWRAQDRIVESETHRFVEVAKVWHVSGNGKIHTMSNAMVLVGEFDAIGRLS